MFQEEKLKELAEQGQADAQYDLGYLYDIRGNNEEAVYWYRKAAEQGHAKAQISLGNLCKYRQKDHDQAMYWYERAAEQGDAESQYELGKLYGKHYKCYRKTRKEWWLKAAKQGHAKAQCELGDLCEDRRDYEEAEKWYLKAANQGHDEAQYKLGNLYEDHYKDYEQAKEWLLKAAKQVHWGAKRRLNAIEVEESMMTEEELLKKRAEQGDAKAQYKIGKLYQRQKDFDTAIYWYREAFKQRNNKGEWRLATLSAKQASIDALYELGLLYEEDKYKDHQAKKVKKWYEEEKKQWHADAKERLDRLKDKKEEEEKHD